MAQRSMTEWRRSIVEQRGTPALQAALAADRVTVFAAYVAARYLTHAEQDAAIGESEGLEFSRRMSAVQAENRGKRRYELTPEEWELIQDHRREQAGD